MMAFLDYYKPLKLDPKAINCMLPHEIVSQFIVTAIFNQAQRKKALGFHSTFLSIAEIQSHLKRCAMANEAKMSIFVTKWNRMCFRLTSYGQINKDQKIADFSTEVMKLNKAFVERVARLFVKRAKIRHTIAFCQWRRDFRKKQNKLSDKSISQMDGMIAANTAYFDRMNALSNDIVKQYSTQSLIYSKQR